MLHLYPDHVTLTVRPGDITGGWRGRERTGLLDDSLVIEGEEAEQKVPVVGKKFVIFN